MKLPSILINNRGFTIVEVLISMGMFVLLAGLTLFIGQDFFQSYSFNSEKDIAISVFQRARSRAMNNINSSGHGVFINNADHEYVIFEGTFYDENDPKNEKIPFNLGISFSGLNEVVFLQLSGNAVDSSGNPVNGSVDITDGVKSIVISINNEGRISW